MNRLQHVHYLALRTAVEIINVKDYTVDGRKEPLLLVDCYTLLGLFPLLCQEDAEFLEVLPGTRNYTQVPGIVGACVALLDKIRHLAVSLHIPYLLLEFYNSNIRFLKRFLC